MSESSVIRVVYLTVDAQEVQIILAIFFFFYKKLQHTQLKL